MKDFKKTETYRIIDHLYDERKEFIILGLCGKVGSGVSTVSSILERDFNELNLPKPSFDVYDTYISNEYRILYNYAEVNWKPFHKIRTSSLITRRILSYSEQNFVKFLEDIHPSKFSDIQKEEIKKTVSNFFNKSMEFNLREAREKLNIDIPDALLPTYIKSDKRVHLSSPQKYRTVNKKKVKLDGTDDYKIYFELDAQNNTCKFNNVDLSNLLDLYIKRRKEKTGFKNQFWIMILKEYLFTSLPGFANEFWNDISFTSKSLRILALQHIGNNLRLSKTPYFTDAFMNDGYNCMAEDINVAIKVFRAYQLLIQGGCPLISKNGFKTIIVVDSIKNPYEAMYLKERYSNFFLMGIYTEDEERKKRLRVNKHLTDTEIMEIDVVEQNSKFKKCIRDYNESDSIKQDDKNFLIIKRTYEQYKKNNLLDNLEYLSPFVSQNVSSCIDTADILINNVDDNSSNLKLKKILLRYVSLVMNPALVLPTPVERCMQIAYTAKPNSGCISRQVGAAVTDKNYHLLSIGWNQQPEGQLPCSYRDLNALANHWDLVGYSDYENDDSNNFQLKIKEQVNGLFSKDESPLKFKGKLPCYCFKDYYNSIIGEKNQVHTRSLHAEETAFLNLGANKGAIENGVLFTTSSPCELCAKKAMYLGVKKIYYVEPYPGVSEKHVLSIGDNNKRPELILFTGAIGTAYNKLYTPLLPRKDENEMWLNTKMNIHIMDKIGGKNEKDKNAEGS